MEKKRQEPIREVLRAFEQRSFGWGFLLARMSDGSNASICPEVQLKKREDPPYVLRNQKFVLKKCCGENCGRRSLLSRQEKESRRGSEN